MNMNNKKRRRAKAWRHTEAIYAGYGVTPKTGLHRFSFCAA
jgi:hypothetical protein